MVLLIFPVRDWSTTTFAPFLGTLGGTVGTGDFASASQKVSSLSVMALEKVSAIEPRGWWGDSLGKCSRLSDAAPVRMAARTPACLAMCLGTSGGTGRVSQSRQATKSKETQWLSQTSAIISLAASLLQFAYPSVPHLLRSRDKPLAFPRLPTSPRPCAYPWLRRANWPSRHGRAPRRLPPVETRDTIPVLTTQAARQSRETGTGSARDLATQSVAPRFHGR